MIVLCEVKTEQREKQADAFAGGPALVFVNRCENIKLLLGEAMYGLQTEQEAGGGSGGRGVRVIAVASAIGGCGKTTVALSVARALARGRRKVLYLNLEEIQSFGCFLDCREYVSGAPCSAMRRNEAGLYQLLKEELRRDGFSYLPPLPSAPEALQITRDAYLRIVREARGSREYNFVFLDLGIGCGKENAPFWQESDQILFLVRQDRCSAVKTETLLRDIDFQDDKYVVVCNHYDEEKENCLGGGKGHIPIHVCIREEQEGVLLDGREVEELACL